MQNIKEIKNSEGYISDTGETIQRDVTHAYILKSR